MNLDRPNTGLVLKTEFSEPSLNHGNGNDLEILEYENLCIANAGLCIIF